MQSRFKNKFKYFEHPSDVGFEACGETLEELFANAALATFSFMTNVEEVGEGEGEEVVEKEVKIKSEDLCSLMFDWLDEMIFLFESELLVPKRFEIKVQAGEEEREEERVGEAGGEAGEGSEGGVAAEFSINGKCSGGRFDPARHESGIIIKAVTYNMMEVKKDEKSGVWKARVVLDV